MQVFKTIDEVRKACGEARKKGLTIGLVPTMGALHAGHASLIKAAITNNDFVIVSVFLNPTQFAPTEDLSSYPKTLKKDCELAEQMGASAVFAPQVADMYPEGSATWVKVEGHMTEVLCGRSRPTHFRGVTTVVTKLFNIVLPDKAYFGQKDGQQAQIIKRMVKDLFMPIEICVEPIVRESDGLALSSRNVYLSKEERQAALVLSRSLHIAKNLIMLGNKDKKAVLNAIQQEIKEQPLTEIDYVEIYKFPDLLEFEQELNGTVFIALAVKIGKTRLIDNLVIENV